MPTFRVFGGKYKDYYILIDAETAEEAYDKAVDHQQWFELETDDVIEPYDVYLNEDTSLDLQLNI